MKNTGRSFFFYLLGFSLFSATCHLGTGKRTDDPEYILASPPFVSTTDSILQSPSDAGLYFRRAELLSKNNFHELAVADYKKSWELKPEELTGLRLASVLSISGRPVESLQFLQMATLRFPEDREFKRMLGDALFQSGKAGEALDLYRSMLKMDSSDYEAWYEMGLLYEQMKDTVNAIRSLEKSYAIQPLDTYALELAHIYAENRNPKALKICDQIIRRDSSGQWADPYFIKGIYYANKQLYGPAILQFDSCILRDWKFTDAYIEKGIAYFKQKNYDRALNTFKMATNVSNTSADAYFWAGRCYEATAKKEDAILNYERAILLDKSFTEAREALKRVKGGQDLL
jgi:tetratricopeptide (TPR) repeat protein